MKTSHLGLGQGMTGLLALLGLTAVTVGRSDAAPPSKPPPVPAAVDIAYMSISNSGAGSYWQTAAIRGLGIDAAGQQTGDSEIWKAAERFTPAIAWDPGGQNLVWVQAVDRKGGRALMIGAPGATPRVVYPFSNTGLRLGQQTDALVAGPGCSGSPVVYFWGITSPSNRGALWVVDPYSASPQPREVYQPEVPPPDDTGGSLQGVGISPLGRILVFGAYSSALGGRAVVTLPLACSSAAALPEAAAPAQPLFPAWYETDKAWIQSFDWSRDGSRLAVSMGRWVESPGGAYVHDPDLWVADLNYSAANGAEQATIQSLGHLPAGAAAYVSWAPSVPVTSCDRLAFVRSGGVWLVDVPRAGFQSSDCALVAPAAVGGMSVGAIDWK